MTRPNSESQIVARKMTERRHMPVKGMLDDYWRREMPSIPSLPWGAADAGALGQSLKANPALTVEQIGKCLEHRLASDDHAPGERVHVWIGSLLRYAQGPLDRYKLLKAASPAALGLRNPERPMQHQAISKASIREQMGVEWFQRAVERREARLPLTDLERDCLREEGLL